MSDLDDELLRPYELDALAMERDRPDASPESIERMLRRLDLAVAVEHGSMDVRGGGPAPGPAGTTGALSSGALAKGALLFLAGVASGGAVVKLATPAPAPAVVALPSPAPPSATLVVSAASGSVAPVDVHALPDRSMVVTPRVAASASAPSDADLVAEAQLVDGVRTALGRQDPGAALDLLDQWSSRYKAGALREETAALRVRALWMAGRNDEAQRLAADFQRRYPRSLFSSMIARPPATTP